jgi:hypothetical protein
MINCKNCLGILRFLMKMCMMLIKSDNEDELISLDLMKFIILKQGETLTKLCSYLHLSNFLNTINGLELKTKLLKGNLITKSRPTSFQNMVYSNEVDVFDINGLVKAYLLAEICHIMLIEEFRKSSYLHLPSSDEMTKQLNGKRKKIDEHEQKEQSKSQEIANKEEECLKIDFEASSKPCEENDKFKQSAFSRKINTLAYFLTSIILVDEQAIPKHADYDYNFVSEILNIMRILKGVSGNLGLLQGYLSHSWIYSHLENQKPPSYNNLDLFKGIQTGFESEENKSSRPSDVNLSQSSVSYKAKIDMDIFIQDDYIFEPQAIQQQYDFKSSSQLSSELKRNLKNQNSDTFEFKVAQSIKNFVDICKINHPEYLSLLLMNCFCEGFWFEKVWPFLSFISIKNFQLVISMSHL